MISNVLLLSISNILIGVLSYCVQLILSIQLSAASFAAFTSILSVALIVSAPFSAASYLLSQSIASAQSPSSQRVSQDLFLFLLGVILAVSCLVVMPLLAFMFQGDYLTLKDVTSLDFLILWVIILLTGWQTTLQGIAWGHEDYFAFVFLMLTQISVRIIGSFFFVIGTTSTLAVFAISHIAAILFAAIRLSGFLKGLVLTFPAIRTIKSDFQQALQMSFATGVSVLVLQCDILIANHVLDGKTFASFALAAVFGKSVFFATGALGIAIFPKIAGSQITTRRLLLTIGSTVAIAILAAGVIYFASDLIIEFIYGNKYEMAATYLKLYGFMISPLCIINVIEFAALAKRQYSFSLWLAVLYGFVIGICVLFPSDVYGLITTLTVGNILVAAAMLAYFQFYLARKSNGNRLA
jgi:O-antigen/teichoic acid export membrane protein